MPTHLIDSDIGSTISPAIETAATHSAINVNTTKRLIYVVADETNNGDASLYLHNGTILKFLQTIAAIGTGNDTVVANLFVDDTWFSGDGSESSRLSLLLTTDITTNNVSTSRHGFAPKAPNDATKFLNGVGSYSVPQGTNVSAWPLLIAQRNNSTLTRSASSFEKITLPTIAFDNRSGWDAVNNWYVIPDTGSYRISMKYRFVDNAPVSVSHGIGANLEPTDDASFFWAKTPGAYAGEYRHGIYNSKVQFLNSGDHIELFSYIDGVAVSINYAELIIERIR